MPYPPRLQWAFALSGVLTEMNGGFHTDFGGWGANEHTAPWCKNTLKDFYGIEDKASFDDMVKWLLGEGHSAEARAIATSLGPDPRMDDPKSSLVRANRAQIDRAGLVAWDVGRLVAVVGWGKWAGFATENDATQILLVAAARTQKAYDSWQAFGQAYELGRLFWSGGKQNDATARALQKLMTDPKSPWLTLPWGLALGVEMLDARPSKVRFKRTICPTCGAPKSRPSQTGYVYCDYCGALSDFDFAKACEKPLERPGPVYENLSAQLKPQLDAALARGDVNAYRAAQIQLFDAYVTVCPNSVPMRTRDPAYRQRYVAYMAEGAVATAFDPTAKQHEAAVAQTTAGLSFVQAKGGMKVSPAAFEAMATAVFAQQHYVAGLHEARGVYAMQPDGASGELQRRLGWSMFAQGWLPMLDEASAAKLLAATRLKGEYQEIEPATGDAATCGSCGAPAVVMQGAKRMICEHCGHKLDAAGGKLPCAGCGASLVPDENAQTFACPHCKMAVQRIQMMR